MRRIRFPALQACLLGLMAMLSACHGVPTSEPGTTVRPIDPYDYNFCGGVPMYPIIGITFSTYCGPRNQLALGRLGTLSWVFPPNGEDMAQQGKRKLTEKELKHLSLLAEAVVLSGKENHQSGAVNYILGIDFRGREIHQRFAVLSDVDTPVNQLYRSMLSMAGVTPPLPDCGPEKPFFDPIQLPKDRHPLSSSELRQLQEHLHGPK